MDKLSFSLLHWCPSRVCSCQGANVTVQLFNETFSDPKQYGKILCLPFSKSHPLQDSQCLYANSLSCAYRGADFTTELDMEEREEINGIECMTS